MIEGDADDRIWSVELSSRLDEGDQTASTFRFESVDGVGEGNRVGFRLDLLRQILLMFRDGSVETSSVDTKFEGCEISNV